LSSIQKQGGSDPASAIPKLEQNAALQVARRMKAVEGALTRKEIDDIFEQTADW
jgi:hypothetical protein